MRPIEVGIDFPFPLSAADAKQQAGLREQVDGHNRDAAEYGSQVSALVKIDDAAWTAEHEAISAGLRGRRRELLMREVTLRERVGAFLLQVANEGQQNAVSAAWQQVEKAKADVKDGLLMLGYTDIPEAMILRHGKVAAAQQTFDALQNADTVQQRSANDKAIVAVRQLLAAMRTKAVAGL